jgi:formylmethanofuran dehydrogenase subunit C
MSDSSSPITLTLREAPSVPLEAEVLTPDALAELRHDEICASQVWLGKRRCRLDELFDVVGQRSEQLRIEGPTGRVKWIGRGMTRGRITVAGDVGMHLGAYMAGGSIEVCGHASDWVGAEMTGGQIQIHGNAGGQVGAAYRGSPTGMRGGMILIAGSAGLEVGMRMRRGTIVVGGLARDFAGLQMKGGTIFLLQGAELRTGAWMQRGTIVSLAPLSLLPTFAYSCRHRPLFLNLYARQLKPHGIELATAAHSGCYDCYWGDAAVPGKGEILVWRP